MAMTIDLDQEGYLKNPSDWNKTIASAIAHLEKLKLTEEHWLIIHYLRNFYQQFPTIKIPALRVIIKELVKLLGKDKANSLYFHQLFPKGLVQAGKIAGLPKGGRCKENIF